MTKKSVARLARDKAQADLDKMSWDELTAINKLKKESFATIVATMRTMVESPVKSFLTPSECIQAGANLRQIGRDMGQMQKELDAVHKLHAGKTGPIDLMDQELWDCFQIFEAYEAWSIRMHAVVKPIMDDTANIFGMAEQRYRAAALQQESPAGLPAAAAV